MPKTSKSIYQMAEFSKLKILNGEFKYEENEFLEVNFSNCVKIRNVDGSYHLQKSNKRRKIDMVDALFCFVSTPIEFDAKLKDNDTKKIAALNLNLKLKINNKK